MRDASRIHPAAPFLLAIGWGAFVLFQLQPMLAKPLLPALGGAPLVWQSCMMVFQGLLLLGYAYAFWLAQRPLRWQRVLHPALWLLALASMAFPLPVLARFDPALQPVWWLSEKLLREIGLPFIAIAATTPLMQAWALRHRPHLGRDSFRLYVASNFGSMAGLLSYPFLVEPWLSLGAQWRLALFGCALQALLVFAAAWALRRVAEAPAAEPVAAAPIPAARQMAWVLYGALGCSLMLGTTHHLSMDVAAVPLLWVLPLALYLLSFMVAFGRFGTRLAALRPYELLIAALVLMVNLIPAPGLALLPPLLAGMFVLCVMAHGWLAEAAPAPEQAARYYLMIALGGVAAGVFNGLIAPLAFDCVVEHGLVILALMLTLAARGGAPSRAASSATGWAVALLGSGGLLAACYLSASRLGIPADAVRWLALGGFCLIFLLLRLLLRQGLFAQCVPLALIVLWSYTAPGADRPLARIRSWFGVMAVTEDRQTGVHRLSHGTTIHGIQRREPGHVRDMLAYYPPLKTVWAHLPGPLRATPFAVVGLGAGTLACLDGGPHAADLFEIDPAMVAIARNPDYFSYLRECGAQARILLGDGRMSLRGIEDGRYGLIVIDAFSSDSVPVHLLTQEALRLYRAKLAPGGVLAFNVSNRYLDLAPVLSSLAAEEGIPAWQWRYTPGKAQQYVNDSVWVFLGAASLPEALIRDSASGVSRLTHNDPARRWTDDYSALWRVLR